MGTGTTNPVIVNIFVVGLKYFILLRKYVFGVKPPGRDTDSSPPSTTHVKKE